MSAGSTGHITGKDQVSPHARAADILQFVSFLGIFPHFGHEQMYSIYP